MTTQRNATSLQLIEAVPAEMETGTKFGPNGRFTFWPVNQTGGWPFAALDATLNSTEPVCFGRTMEELVAGCNHRLAFEAVQNPANWKGAIDAIVLAEHVGIVADAIEAHTATKARVFDYGFGGLAKRMVAAGYYAGPAA